MKKGLCVLVLLTVGFTLFAGGAKEAPAARPEARQILMRLAETHPPEHPTTKGNMEFARLVSERTNGRIRIEVFHSAQLGEERAVIEQVQFGGIDFTRVSIAPVAAFAPQLNALQMPFLYRNAEHMWKVLEGPIGDEILKSLEPANFVGLNWYDAGARSFYNSKREVRSPADLRGLKIRVMQSELFINMVAALGAIPTPMPFGEVYSALKTGVIDGAENNWPSYILHSHFEVARFFTVNEHTRVPEITLASKIVFDRLSREDQAIIRQAARDAMPFQRAEWRRGDEAAQERARRAGVIITPIPDNSAFMAAVQPLYDRLSPELQEVVRRIRAVQ